MSWHESNPETRLRLSRRDLQEGQDVDVFLIPHPVEPPQRRSVVEFLDSLPPGPRSAPTWDEIDRQLQEERDAWDH